MRRTSNSSSSGHTRPSRNLQDHPPQISNMERQTNSDGSNNIGRLKCTTVATSEHFKAEWQPVHPSPAQTVLAGDANVLLLHAIDAHTAFSALDE